MLYTRKGDKGTTGLFSAKGRPASGWGCDQRISKSSAVAEALGTLDETNSFIGFCKARARKEKLMSGKIKVDEILHNVQKNLFIAQAEVAGASMFIEESKVKEVEEIVDRIEKELPPITTFFIPGSSELSAMFDVARTISRRAERRVVAVVDGYASEKKKKIEDKEPVSEFTLAYLNRLSSLLYAFARLANHKAGAKEEIPDYK